MGDWQCYNTTEHETKGDRANTNDHNVDGAMEWGLAKLYNTNEHDVKGTIEWGLAKLYNTNEHDVKGTIEWGLARAIKPFNF